MNIFDPKKRVFHPQFLVIEDDARLGLWMFDYCFSEKIDPSTLGDVEALASVFSRLLDRHERRLKERV